MRSQIMAVAAAAALSLVGVGAEAMPAQVAAGSSAASPLLTLVAEGCGPGFVRGVAGGCRRVGRAVVVERPAVVVRRPAVVVRRPAVVVRRPGVVLRRPGCGVRVGPIGVRTPC